MPSRLNYSLIRVFVTLLTERSVSRTAKQLGQSQPTVSKQLGLLRDIFNDPLFIRSSSEMVPTHRGRIVGKTLKRVAVLLEGLEPESAAFNPADSHSHFVIGTSDYGSYVVLPTLIAYLQTEAPNVTLTTKAINTKTAEELLLSGEADLCLASDPQYSYPIRDQSLFDDEYVCLCRKGHPAERIGLDFESFLSFKHLTVHRQSGGNAGVVEAFLASHDRLRTIAMAVSTLLAVPQVLRDTDLLLTTTRQIAALLCQAAPLQIYTHPLPLSTFTFAQIWHERNTHNMEHAWLRNVIARCTEASNLGRGRQF